MAQRQTEQKVFQAFTTKIDAEQGIVEAIVNVFGILDDGGDIVQSGSFVKTLTERARRVKVLNAHNSWDVRSVIGKVLAMREAGRDELPETVLKEWPEATGGLWTQTQYLLDTPEGKGAFDRIKADAVNEYSIGYEAMQVEYRKVDWRGQSVNARLLKEIRLWEYSPVVWGMNPATATTGVKADSKETTAQGVVMRVGDYLQGQVRYVVNSAANRMLTYGRFSGEDVRAVNAALEAAAAAFMAALPESLALMPMSSGGWYWDSADGPKGAKALTPAPSAFASGRGEFDDEKAGRVLSTRNITKIRAAVVGLSEVLADAGEADDGTDDGSEDEEAGKAGAQAGPEAETPPPTDDARAKMLADIERHLTTMEA